MISELIDKSKKKMEDTISSFKRDLDSISTGRANPSAFSLIELSIVVLIIGVLIAGVTQGSRLVAESKLKSARGLTASSPVNSITNLTLWLDSTSEKSFIDAENGTAISTWYDLSEQNVNKNSAIAGNAPTYVTNSLNGLPVIRFNGTSNYLTFDGTSLAGSDYSIIVVERRLDNRVNSYFISNNGSTIANNILYLGYRTDTLVTFAQFANDYNITVSGFSSAKKAIIHSFRFSKNLGKNYYLNGISQTLIPVGAVPTQGLLAYNNAQIGRAEATYYYYGDIAEIIIYNKYLKNSEKDDIERYLSKKWAIPLQ